MANANTPQGFRPVRYLDGSKWNGATNLYVVLSSDGNQINVGDTVKAAANADANGIPAVTKVTAATDAVRGVVVGVLVAAPNDTSLVGTNIDLSIQNIPATKARNYYVLVVDDPTVIFEVQGDSSAANQIATSSNRNASYTITNPTSPQQVSASVLSGGSIAVNAALPLKLFGLNQIPGNGFGAYARWLVRFNLHELGGSNNAGV